MKLSGGEKFALELPAFYEGVILYQNADSNRDLFEKNKRQVYQAPEPIMNIAMSIELERSGGVISADRIIGVYDKDDMVLYFESLRKCARNNEDDPGLPVAIVISSRVHSITVTYDPITDEFSLINANESQNFDAENKSVILRFKEVGELANKTREAFQTKINDDEPLILNSTMFAAKNDGVKAGQVMAAWRSEMEEIHRVTPDKIKLKDKLGGDLEGAAIRGGDLQTTKVLHTKGNFFRRHRKMILGFLAAGLIIGAGVAIAAATLGAATPLTAAMIATGVTVAAGTLGAGTAVAFDHQDTRETRKVDRVRQVTFDQDIEMNVDEMPTLRSSTATMNATLSHVMPPDEKEKKKIKQRKMPEPESESTLSGSQDKSVQIIVPVNEDDQVKQSKSESDVEVSDSFKMHH